MPEENISVYGKKEDAGREYGNVAEAIASPPPDGGYGWVCLFAFFCCNAFTWGVIAVSTARFPKP